VELKLEGQGGGGRENEKRKVELLILTPRLKRELEAVGL